ncbi:hypothetical protein K3495_g9077 [Podosphaera aphanis]|nr:hypothetical protein K3495_g9077 [Podosphaera aphanis]
MTGWIIQSPQQSADARPFSHEIKEYRWILAPHRAGISNREIADQFRVTKTQVQGAVRSGRVFPQPRSGRPPSLSSAQVEKLEAFVCSCQKTQQMSFLELALHFRQWGAGEFATRNALRKRGYERRLPRKCSPPLPKTIAWYGFFGQSST